MTTADIINDLCERGIVLTTDDGLCLTVDAPAGELTPADRQNILRHKPDILTTIWGFRVCQTCGFDLCTNCDREDCPSLRDNP